MTQKSSIELYCNKCREKVKLVFYCPCCNKIVEKPIREKELNSNKG